MSTFLNILLWVVQGLVALLYVSHGWLYVTMTPAREARFIQRRPGMKPSGLSPAFLKFIGLAELAAAVGVLLPGITGILPWLIPLAAAGLAIIMLGSIFYHLSRQEASSAVSNSVILLLLLFLAYMRWQVVPL